MGSIIWIIIVGFVAGIIARYLSPGPKKPSGFILTTLLGIAGAFLATWVGQAIGHYSPDQGAGFIMATTGYLKTNPNPTRQELAHGVSGNLCRCQDYDKILTALMRGAEHMRGEA